MEMDLLQEKNWPKLDGRSSNTSKHLHEWCSKISQFFLHLTDRMTQLESKKNEKHSKIKQMKSDLESTKKEQEERRL